MAQIESCGLIQTNNLLGLTSCPRSSMRQWLKPTWVGWTWSLLKWTEKQAQYFSMSVMASSSLITTATERQDYPSPSRSHSYIRLYFTSPRVNSTNFAIALSINLPETGHSVIGFCYSPHNVPSVARELKVPSQSRGTRESSTVNLSLGVLESYRVEVVNDVHKPLDYFIQTITWSLGSSVNL